MDSIQAPSLPMEYLVPGILLWIVLAAVVLPKLRGVAVFLFLALSARFLVNFFHFQTVQPMLGEQSINSLVTLAIAVGGVFACRRNLLRYKVFVPVYILIATLVISGLWNGSGIGSVNAVIRQFIFLSILIGFLTALDFEPNDGSFSSRILAIFIVPLFYQAVTIVLDMGKAVESDGSISYIGGYVHESVFSTMVLSGMVVAALAAGLSWRYRTLYLAILYASLVFANYRTAVLAGAPIIFTHVVFGSATHFRADLAGLIRTIASLVATLTVIVLGSVLAERMSDLGVILSNSNDLILPPSQYSLDDRLLLNGRLFIWSEYVHSILTADISNIFFGFGPDAWIGRFSTYAHNVYVSHFYEIGLLGLAALILVQGSFLGLAFRVRRDKRAAIISCHVAYIVLGLGTMPTYSIEGVLLYGIICGYTVYYYVAARSPAHFVIPENFVRSSPARTRAVGRAGQQRPV